MTVRRRGTLVGSGATSAGEGLRHHNLGLRSHAFFEQCPHRTVRTTVRLPSMPSASLYGTVKGPRPGA